MGLRCREGGGCYLGGGGLGRGGAFGLDAYGLDGSCCRLGGNGVGTKVSIIVSTNVLINCMNHIL